MFPRGMQLGTTADVTVSGRDLDELSDLLFSHPGIQATVKTVSPSEFEAARTLPNQFAVEVAENVPPGIYEARTVGRFGVSTPLPFFVHQETQAIESGDNHTVDKAIPVLIPGVIHGRCDPNQTDFFKVNIKVVITTEL